MLIDTLDTAYPNGFSYTSMRPAAPEDVPARIQRAQEVIDGKLWREQLSEWDEVVEPASIAAHRAIQAVDPDALDTEELSAYLERCQEHHAAMITQHMRFTAAAMIPTGDFLEHGSLDGTAVGGPGTGLKAQAWGSAARDRRPTVPFPHRGRALPRSTDDRRSVASDYGLRGIEGVPFGATAGRVLAHSSGHSVSWLPPEKSRARGRSQGVRAEAASALILCQRRRIPTSGAVWAKRRKCARSESRSVTLTQRKTPQNAQMRGLSPVGDTGWKGAKVGLPEPIAGRRSRTLCVRRPE
jgi:hypothetical protein